MNEIPLFNQGKISSGLYSKHCYQREPWIRLYKYIQLQIIITIKEISVI